MLSQNGYNDYVRQSQEPFQQQQPYQQNFNLQNVNNGNYYSTGIIQEQTHSSNIQRNKSYKNLLKKFQNETIKGNLDKVQYYVENYGLLNETEHSLHGGRTCLMLSISKNNFEIISYFCQQPNIDLNARGNFTFFFFFFFKYNFYIFQ